mmetsp:Transcript_20731/g.65569  ORF Transcript_20731/g.65569 Transcript_20731/m.65569 type:complete len:402 (+) Transcript_20731:235-1440(+)
MGVHLSEREGDLEAMRSGRIPEAYCCPGSEWLDENLPRHQAMRRFCGLATPSAAHGEARHRKRSRHLLVTCTSAAASGLLIPTFWRTLGFNDMFLLHHVAGLLNALGKGVSVRFFGDRPGMREEERDVAFAALGERGSKVVSRYQMFLVWNLLFTSFWVYCGLPMAITVAFPGAFDGGKWWVAVVYQVLQSACLPLWVIITAHFFLSCAAMATKLWDLRDELQEDVHRSEQGECMSAKRGDEIIAKHLSLDEQVQALSEAWAFYILVAEAFLVIQVPINVYAVLLGRFTRDGYDHAAGVPEWVNKAYVLVIMSMTIAFVPWIACHGAMVTMIAQSIPLQITRRSEVVSPELRRVKEALCSAKTGFTVGGYQIGGSTLLRMLYLLITSGFAAFIYMSENDFI